MKKTAILLDMGFVLLKLKKALSNRQPTAVEIRQFALKCLEKDEEIFLEPKIVAPALSVVAPTANPNPEPLGITKQPAEPRGAKLKIQRLSLAQQAEEPSIPETVKVELAAPAPVVATPSEEAPAAEAKPRVIIIRRPASEAAEIPMMEDSSPEVAA